MMMEILGRLGKPNVLIIGDAGVGKTALVDGLACNIIEGTVPQYLKDMTIYELDTGTLIAGATYKGEIEERLKGIIKELSAHGNAILFIDEIHTLIDPKSGNNGAASILKPELAKGNITVIGVTTVDEYRKLIEPDHALNRRFEVLQVSEPDLTSTVNMIQAALERYENYHGVGVDVDSLPECVALAKRYVKERRLPDAAIDLIDRTLSAVKMINQSGEKYKRADSPTGCHRSGRRPARSGACGEVAVTELHHEEPAKPYSLGDAFRRTERTGGVRLW